MSIGETLKSSGNTDTAQKGSIDLTPDGGQINDVVVEGDLNGDWGKVFELFNLDPNEFEVVDETVRMSTWQQSARAADGTRDVVQLYSYSARFRRVTREMLSDKVIDSWRVDLQNTEFTKAKKGRNGVYSIMVADPQIGKKGTAEAIENWRRGVRKHIDAIKDLVKLGKSPKSIHIAFMGDEHEGIANHYTNQTHVIEMNRTQQMEKDYDMRVWTIKQLGLLGLPMSVSSVVSNHGEWSRNGSRDPVTTRGDNGSTFITRMVKRLFDAVGELDITWYIGEEEPGVTVTLDGVECYFSHGYVEKGRGATVEARMKNAIERQILGRTEELGTTKLWIMAHYHHHYAQEFEGRTLIGCPALEAERSSEYMLDQYGVWSPPGMLGMLITSKEKRGWANQNIF